MTEAKPQVNPRALPSEMILLLLLLAATVLLNVFFVANWLSSLEQGGAGSLLQKLQILLMPGLAVYALYTAIRIRRSTPLAEIAGAPRTRTRARRRPVVVPPGHGAAVREPLHGFRLPVRAVAERPVQPRRRHLLPGERVPPGRADPSHRTDRPHLPARPRTRRR